MAIKISEDFDYKTIALDALETIVRDDLDVNVENWAKFRHSMSASVNADKSLISKSASSISTEVKTSYIELSKSHYETVTMLGATKISLNTLKKTINTNPLIVKKSLKEFYMHAGSVLDNLARVIYIVNLPNAPYAIDKYKMFRRHSIGYGQLKSIYKANKAEMKGYYYLVYDRAINEIKTIRNNFTHSWSPVTFINEATSEYFMPAAMRKKEQYYLWPHDPSEVRRIKIEYRKKIPLIKMLEDD